MKGQVGLAKLTTKQILNFIWKSYRTRCSNRWIVVSPENMRDQWMFLQDNAPCHTGGIVKQWFQDNKIKTVRFPAYSPDLNPIENAWKVVSNNVYSEKTLYESKEELFEAFSKAFYGLTSEYCKNLVSSMPRRIQAVIQAKGGYTKY